MPSTTNPPKTLRPTTFGTLAFERNGIEVTGFFHSLNTVGQYDPLLAKSEKFPRENGFKVISTGGHCSAWHQDFLLDGVNVHMMLTDDSGITHKIDCTDRLLVGVYRSGEEHAGGEAIAMWEQTNWPLGDDNKPEVTCQYSGPDDGKHDGACPVDAN